MAKTLGRIGNLIKDKSDAKERATLKGLEIAKIKKVQRKNVKFSGADYDIEIVDMNPIEGGVEVFARAWNPDGSQIGFGKDGSVDIERFRIFNPPVMVPDGTKTLTVDEDGRDRLHDNFKEDAESAILLSLSHTIRVKKQKFGPEKIKSGKVGNTTTTVYPDAHTESTSVDGGVSEIISLGSNNTSWSTLQSGSGTNASDNDATITSGTGDGSVSIRCDTSSDWWARLERAIVLFDTSSIDDGDTLDSATLSVYGTFKNDDLSASPTLNVFSSAPASNTALVAGDFDSLGTTEYSSDITYASYSTSGYNDFTLNASGEAAVDFTGVSKFGLRESTYDAPNSSPTHPGSSQTATFSFRGAEQTGTTNDPKLVIEHSSPSADPSVNDTVTVTESITVMVSDEPNVNDQVTVTESITMMVDDNPNVFDTVTVTEVVTMEVFGGDPNVFDTVTITESVTLLIEQLVPDVSEDVTITEAITMLMDLNIDVAEDVTVTDVVTEISVPTGASVTDDVTVSESVEMMVDLNINVNDSVTVTEGVAAGAVITIAEARDGLIHMRSTEQDYPLMMDDNEVR